MNSVVAIAVVCATAVLISLIISNQQVVMYEQFNKQFITAQILELELQHRYNNGNITINVYEPPVGFM